MSSVPNRAGCCPCHRSPYRLSVVVTFCSPDDNSHRPLDARQHHLRSGRLLLSSTRSQMASFLIMATHTEVLSLS